MLPEITQLLQLQERDIRLRGLQKDIKDVPMLLQRAKLQLAGDQAAVDAALQKTRDIEVKIKSVELDIQTRQTSIKRLQDQQFETRKNDEFQAIGHEIKRYETEIRGHEDKELEARINALGLNDRFRMPGFTKELDALLPWATMFVIPSYTEGLPNVEFGSKTKRVPKTALLALLEPHPKAS